MKNAEPLELLRRAADALTAAGLVNFEPLDMSGALAMCGTTQKPHGQAGRYKLHLDDWPRLWLCNYHEGGEWQTINLYERGEVERLSLAEKTALRERVAREKAAALEAREQARKATTERATGILGGLPLAGAGNAYLARKEVPPLGGVKQDSAGRLVVPVRDERGRLASLQYVTGDGGKRFLSGPLPVAYFFPIPAKDGGKGGPLLIAEGYATAASLHLATGHGCLVAFSAGNLEAVARMARERYPEREIVLCADYGDPCAAWPEPGGNRRCPCPQSRFRNRGQACHMPGH